MLSDPILIAPSVLSADFTQLATELKSIKTADYLHFDVMDGHFVPNLTFGPDILRAARSCTDLPLDVHLMVTNPEQVVPLFLNAGADVVSFHIEATAHAHRLVGQIHDAGARAGVVINPATPVSTLESIIDDVDLVLVMTVNPGFGGQRFIPGCLRKIKQLRHLCDEHGVSPIIEVDGGIAPDTAAAVAEAGATLLVAGSAVFGQQDRASAINAIREAAVSGLTRKA